MGADKSARRYRGKGATGYEAKRAGKNKWIQENIGVEELFPQGVRNVLDVPVGTGRFFYLYKRLGVNPTGLDTSPDMLREARKKGMLMVKLADIRAIPFEDDTFDVAVCMRLFPWFEPGEVAWSLRELARVARILIVGIRVNDAAPFCKSGSLWNHFLPDFLQWVREADRTVVAEFHVGTKGNNIYRLEPVCE